LVVFFPEADRFWKLSDFDDGLSSEQKKNILKFYHRMIQKHLYFHGGNRRYLSKNPSFVTWVSDLKLQYSDASFVLCQRPPEKTIPSQLSSLGPTWTLLYGSAMPDSFSKKIVVMLAKYYQYLDRTSYKEVNAISMDMADLASDLKGSILAVLDHCDLELTEAFKEVLNEELSLAKAYKSTHTYSVDCFNWSELKGLFPEGTLRSSLNSKVHM
jgi:hypothetical protein